MLNARGRFRSLALLCALTVTACTPGPIDTPPPTPPVSATPTETAAERQERLDYAAAEKAYRTFRAEYGRVLRAGGAREPTRLMKATAGGPYLKELLEVLQAYKGLGDRRTGQEEIVYVRPGGYEVTELVLSVCEDSRAVKILDRAGKRVGSGQVRAADINVRKSDDEWRLWSGTGKAVSSCD